MSKSNFPPGWDEERVKIVLKHYDEQPELEAVAEDEAAFTELPETVVKVPVELMPAVRELLGKFQSQEPSS